MVSCICHATGNLLFDVLVQVRQNPVCTQLLRLARIIHVESLAFILRAASVKPAFVATYLKQATCIKQTCIQFLQKANTLKSTFIKQAHVLSKLILSIP